MYHGSKDGVSGRKIGVCGEKAVVCVDSLIDSPLNIFQKLIFGKNFPIYFHAKLILWQRRGHNQNASFLAHRKMLI